ncbi:MAG: hypothetical protein L6R42_008415 [Xanthoria sp. 1 TBL-2021]|nr:MAG: hypothetical protein L6R42_008415 [Xanthoria sp. 1 TBL-2021]
MSKPLKAFREALLNQETFKKIFGKHTPGKRIAPAQAGDNDSKYQLRLDAGEVVGGNQAKNEALKEFKKKNGTHANLATATVDENTTEADQKKVFDEFWEDIEKQAKSKLG